MNTTAAPSSIADTPAISTDSFKLAVEDIIAALRKDGDIDDATVVAAIVDAHHARLQPLNKRIFDAERSMASLMSQDRCNREVIEQVKRTVGQLVMTNSRKAAHVEHLSAIRDDVETLMRTAEKNNQQVSVQDLSATVFGRDFRAYRMEPTVVAMVPDTRWTFGSFTDSAGRTVRLPFLGWSLVVHSLAALSGVEPTFLGHGNKPVTLGQLSAAPLTLDKLA